VWEDSYELVKAERCMSLGKLKDAANGAVADDAVTVVAVNSSGLEDSGGRLHWG
jgi:hypothetical protein